MNELQESRREFEGRLEEVQAAIEEKVGWAPRAKAWVVPLLALAAGVAAAWWLRRDPRRLAGRSSRR